MDRPDCVRRGDHETERLLRRAFRAGYHEDVDRTLPDQLDGAFEDWRGGVVTREAPSLSLSQIDWLEGVIEVARSRVHKLYDQHDTEATLRTLRAALTKEDDAHARD